MNQLSAYIHSTSTTKKCTRHISTSREHLKYFKSEHANHSKEKRYADQQHNNKENYITIYTYARSNWGETEVQR